MENLDFRKKAQLEIGRKFKSQLYNQQGLKKEDLQTEMLIDRFFEAAWEADDLLDYIGGNPFEIGKEISKVSKVPTGSFTQDLAVVQKLVINCSD